MGGESVGVISGKFTQFGDNLTQHNPLLMYEVGGAIKTSYLNKSVKNFMMIELRSDNRSELVTFVHEYLQNSRWDFSFYVNKY